MKRFKSRIASALVSFGIETDTTGVSWGSKVYIKKYDKALTKYTAEIIKAFKEKVE